MKVRYLPEVERNMTPAVAALTINLIRRKYCGWCRATSTRCVYSNLLVLSACRGKHVIQSIQAALWVKPKPPGEYQLPELFLLWGVAHRRHSKWAGKLDKCGRRTQRFHRSATYRAVLSMRIRGLTIEWTSIRKTFSATPNDTKTYSVVQKCVYCWINSKRAVYHVRREWLEGCDCNGIHNFHRDLNPIDGDLRTVVFISIIMGRRGSRTCDGR